MNWSETRKKLLQLASGRASRHDEEDLAPRLVLEDDPFAEENGRPPSADEAPPARVRASSLCVASGKGGTGKTVVSAALAGLFSARGRTLVVDADLGVGNAHILQDVSPAKSFVDVVEGRLSVREVLVPCSGQIDLLAAGSGVPRMADLSAYEMHLIAGGLEELEYDYRYLIVDSAAGISRQTMAFAEACDQTLLVTTPDLTAMTDAYAFLKVLLGRQPDRRPLLVVNRARSDEEAEEVFDRIARVSERFLGARPHPLGWLPEDPAVCTSVNQRGSVVQLEPHAPISAALRRTSVAVLEDLTRDPPRGMGHSMLSDVGFTARFA